MNDENRTAGTPDDGLDPSLRTPPATEAGEVHSTTGHDSVVMLAFRERPYYDQMLMKTHPSLVYFDAFMLHPTPNGYVPVLVSSVLVDTAIRH